MRLTPECTFQQTETFDDYGSPLTDSRFEKFADFHAYLEDTFPRVFTRLQVEKPQKYGLLITYPGKNGHAALGGAALKPIVLMAHQDTVPVDPGTIHEWEQPPFSGTLDEEGWIWGVSPPYYVAFYNPQRQCTLTDRLSDIP